MRKILLSLLLLQICCGFFCAATAQQKAYWACGDDKLSALEKKANPAYEQMLQKRNLDIKQYIKLFLQKQQPVAAKLNGGDDNTYTIPVVVHVVHPAGEAYGTGTNISYAQIRSQIEALNAAFGRSYATYNGQAQPDYAQNTNIHFCLARNTMPQTMGWYAGPGGTEFGVMRYDDNTGAYDQSISISSATQLLSITHPTADYFPFDKYLNIWLVASIDGASGTMGYAPKPLMGEYPLDGVVIRADIFGDNTAGSFFNLDFALTQGKVLAHEVGHYFNLYHIFQGGCSGLNAASAATDACDLNGDYICDIEPCTTQNVYCDGTVYNTCTANYNTGTTKNDMINDYMSYADDDCMNTFTEDQTQRMWATLQLQRSNLWNAANLAATGVLGEGGCVPPYLNATINKDKEVICAGDTVVFSNPVQGNTATGYQWQFTGGTSSSANTNTISVLYNNPGTYTAILTVRDGINTRTDSMQFTVSECKLDSLYLSMAHWYFGDYCSIDFSTGSPVKTTTALVNHSIHGESVYEGQLPYNGATVSVSDSSGNLLFYASGTSVWDSHHKKISKGFIFGHSDINYTTGLCAIPYPGKKNLYFLVGVYPDLDNKPSGVRYVLIDTKANTVSAYKELKNAASPKRFSEMLTVVPHCNGTDYWIITKGAGYDSDNNYYSFLVTQNGIDINQAPVISTGFAHPAYGGEGDELKANRAGDKLFLCSPHGYIDIEAGALYDFDSHTGIVSNERIVPNVTGYNNIQSGTAFSPNGEYFFLMRSTNLETNGPPYWLFQYRVSDFAYKIIPTTGFYFGSPFQIGPDNQLYIINLYNYLAQLTEPDKWGGGVFDGELINFNEPTFTMRPGASLPAFIDAQPRLPTHPDFLIETISCDSFTFNNQCFDKYTATWNFGDNTPLQKGHVVHHRFSKPGDYNVTLTLSDAIKTYGSTTKKITVLPSAISITGPDSVCNSNNFAMQYFAPDISNAIYTWLVSNGTISGANNLAYAGILWQNGTDDSSTIHLNVSIGEHCSIDAYKKVSLQQKPVITWALPDSVCVTDSSFALSATPPGGAFVGAGVNGNIFSPQAAGAGNKQLTYQYGKGSLCYTELQQIINVKARCKDSIIIPPLPPPHPFPVDTTTIPSGPEMPTAFTPNADGLNDLYRIPPGLIKQLDQFVIYNRWGSKIFATKNVTTGWNGTYKNSPVMPGTYIYVVSGINNNNERVTLKGTVTLIR